MQLSANTDSGYVEFKQNHFTGWSQLPKEEKKDIDFFYEGFPLLQEGNTPWAAGLLIKYKNTAIALSYFDLLFSNKVNWKRYEVLNTEKIIVNNKKYLCWKVNAGREGPPGYTSYQWYEAKTGKFVKGELLKEGVDLKFISELQNTNSK